MVGLMMTVVVIPMTCLFVRGVHSRRVDARDARRFRSDVVWAQQAKPEQQSRHQQGRRNGAQKKGYCGAIGNRRPLTQMTSRHLRHHAVAITPMPTVSFLPKIAEFARLEASFPGIGLCSLEQAESVARPADAASAGRQFAQSPGILGPGARLPAFDSRRLPGGPISPLL
jgi:hypothetical protein